MLNVLHVCIEDKWLSFKNSPCSRLVTEIKITALQLTEVAQRERRVVEAVRKAQLAFMQEKVGRLRSKCSCPELLAVCTLIPCRSSPVVMLWAERVSCSCGHSPLPGRDAT
jgi:hypothetical protein